MNIFNFENLHFQPNPIILVVVYVPIICVHPTGHSGLVLVTVRYQSPCHIHWCWPWSWSWSLTRSHHSLHAHPAHVASGPSARSRAAPTPSVVVPGDTPAIPSPAVIPSPPHPRHQEDVDLVSPQQSVQSEGEVVVGVLAVLGQAPGDTFIVIHYLYSFYLC